MWSQNSKNKFLSSLFKDTKEEDNDPISKFLTSHNILQDIKYAEGKENINKKMNSSNGSSRSEKASPIKSKEIPRYDNIIISNSFFNSDCNCNNKKPKTKNINKTKNLSNDKNINFPLAIVELKDIEKEKKDKIFLTQSVKKKKKININLKEEKKSSFFRNNKIIYNFYTNYMKRQKQLELIDSKLFKQKLISQFLKYSPNYMRKAALKTEQNLNEQKIVLEQMKTENSVKKYNNFKDIIKKRLTKGNIDSDNENSNLFINSIYNYLYKNIMNYDSLIILLNKFKAKLPLNFAKMISEFLSLRFDCFKRIKNEIGGQYKMIKLCDFLKVEKFKKGDIIYDIDNYEKYYYFLLKGNIDVYQIFFVREKMTIKKFIDYLKDIKDNNKLFKFYRILQRNRIEKVYDKLDIIEKILNDEKIDNNNNNINLSDINDFYIEEMRQAAARAPGDNINNEYNDYRNPNVKFINKNGSFLIKSIPSFIKDFFNDKDNRMYYKKNYSDKKYICSEDCVLLSIEKDIYEKKMQDMDMKLFGENNDMLLLYTYIFKNWEKENINSIIKNFFHKIVLSYGEYLYQQNDLSNKIYIVIRGEFSQSMSLNSKRIQEMKNYISFNKNNIFTMWKNKPKKTINKEEIEKFFEKEEKSSGDFPFEIKGKNTNVGITIFNIKYYLKKKKEESEKNDIQDIKLKNRYKFEVLGMEEAIEGKHRFVSTKCESKKGEILEINIVDFVYFCFHRNIKIDNLKEIISDLKDILIQKIEKIIQVHQNNLIKKNDNYPTEINDGNENETSKKFKLKIHKEIYRKNYFEENKPFDPFEIAMHNIMQIRKKKLKEKYDVKTKRSNLTYTNKNYYNNYKNLFYDYIGNKSQIKNSISNSNKDNNNNNEENTLEINVFESNRKSARDIKKLVFDYIKAYNNSYSVRKNKNKKKNEREEIRERYLKAKKKLEESYFNREKIYYMKNFKNFPFVNYIYTKNKKGAINTEESLFYRLNKDLKKQKKFENFIKMLNSGKENSKILFSKSVIREAGYFSKNNSYKKIDERNIYKGKSKMNSFCKTDYRKGNKYNLDLCFLKYIDFSKINDNKKYK